MTPGWNPGGGGVLPYMGYIGMCGPKAVLVINRVSSLADFRVCFLYSSPDVGMFLNLEPFYQYYRK